MCYHNLNATNQYDFKPLAGIEKQEAPGSLVALLPGAFCLEKTMEPRLKPINELRDWDIPDVAIVCHISPWMVDAGFDIVHAIVYSELAGTPPREGHVSLSNGLLKDVCKHWHLELEEVQEAFDDLMSASYIVPDYNCTEVMVAVIGCSFAEHMMDRLDKEGCND